MGLPADDGVALKKIARAATPGVSPVRRIRVLIVGDIRLYRDGLALVLSDAETVEIVGRAGSLPRAVDVALDLQPDVVLLDMAMADSIATIEGLTAAVPSVRTVALAVPEAESAVINCAEAGVAGYVTRDGTLEDLLNAIAAAASGETFCPPKLAGMLVRRVAAVAHAQAPPPESVLTPRELEVALLLDKGLTNKQIASRLFIEVATVKNHVHSVLEKLHVHRRADAASRLRGSMI